MPPTSLYVSRPRLSVDGQADSSLSGNVLSLLVEESTEGLARAEVILSNYGFASSGADFLYFKRDVLDFGKELTVEMGPDDEARVVFRGRLSGMEAEYPTEGGARLVVLLEDGLQNLRLTRRSRSFEDMSDADVIQQIASEHKLTPQVSLDGPTHASLAQVNQSDLAFVRDRARSLGGELWLDGTTLHATKRPERDGEKLALRYGEELLQFEVRADLAHQCSEVGVSGWDVGAKQGIDETGDTNALGSELGNLLSGTSLLEQAFGARKEKVVHDIPLTTEEARALAAARYLGRARRFVTGSGVADGAPRLRVGCSVTLSGLGDLFNGDYYVSRVRHTYEPDRGYRTEFDVERPGIGRSTGQQDDPAMLATSDPSLERSPLGSGGLFYGVYPAVVSDNQDPDNQGRVKVQLPWAPDTAGATYETWARLSTLMAGGSRGTWFVPDVGDEVLVAFEGGHPRRPYVVGSLWNGQDAPPEQMDSQNNLKTILSRSGVRITLDDSSGAVKLRLETPGGHKIVLDDGQLSVTIQDSNGNSAKMDTGGITVTAVAQVKISCASVEVDAPMVTVNAGMSKFSGVVQCDALIANAVIGTTYTPGAGNIW